MKERLTGAIILVVLIVLLVPELLSGPKVTPAPVGSTAASSEDVPLRSYTINLGDDANHAHGTSSSASGPAMPQPTAPEQPATDNSAQATNAPSAGDQAASAPATAAQTSAAMQAPSPKDQAPPPSATQPATAATRSDRTVAAKAAPVPKAVKSASTAAPAAKVAAKPRPAPAAAADSGWGVQLGVFSSHENADKLVQEVRGKGFKASVAPITTGGRKLYRVRVGPTADRAAAQALQGRLKAAGRAGGAVVPYT